MCEGETRDRIGLLAIALVSTLALTWVGVLALKLDKVDPNSATLVGVIVGYLGATIKDIIAAIRGYSMSAQLGKVTDQLAASGPSQTVEKANVVNQQGEAR